MSYDQLSELTLRGFAREVGFGEKPALLVVDYIKGFTDPALDLGSDASEGIAQTNRLITAARSADLPIFFSAIRYEEENLLDAGVWICKIEGLRTLSIASGGAEIDNRLLKSPADQIIVKKFASCFFGTDLMSRLVLAKVDTLILAGCTTSGCVRATAVDACQYGFRTIVAREAVVDRVAASHDQSLFDIHLKYGDVMSVDSIIDKLSR